LKRIEELPKSKHFELQELQPGIYAAICGQRGAGIGNAGLIDLGDRLLIFDTFLTPQAAADLLAMAQALSGREPELVINSHYHNDHIWGSQVFLPRAQILSSEGTRQLILSEGQEEFDWYGAQSAARLEALRRQYAESEDAAEKENLLPWLDYYEGLVEAFPELTLCLPQMTFAERFTIYGSGRQAELLTFENGHTASDTILYLPDGGGNGILFAADLLFVQTHPFFLEADPLQLIAILEEIETMPFDKIVPGHGPVGTKEDVRLLIDYVKFCFETAERLIAAGTVEEADVNALSLPSPYDSWQIPHFFGMNMRHLIKILNNQSNH
jgi:glyoxylase-like metal-dependent hydrolase (beta-lactamase superfamily II)